MPMSDRPTRQELELLLRHLGPEIARIFRRHGISEDEAQLFVSESLAELVRKWGRVKNRERWFLRNLTDRAESSRP